MKGLDLPRDGGGRRRGGAARRLVAAGGAAAGLVALTAVLVPARDSLSLASIVLIYLTAVVIVATTGWPQATLGPVRPGRQVRVELGAQAVSQGYDKRGSVSTPPHLKCIAHRGACGKPRAVRQNRRP